MLLKELALRLAIFFAAAFLSVLGLHLLRPRVSRSLYAALWVSVIFLLVGLAAWFGRAHPAVAVPALLLALPVGGLVAMGFAGVLSWLFTGADREEGLPEHPQLGAAQAARKRGNLAEAERLLREAIARRPDHVDARAELGDVLAEAERPAEAAAALAEASRGVDDVDRALRLGFRAAELWERAGDRARALAALDDLAVRVRGTAKAELVAARRARLLR